LHSPAEPRQLVHRALDADPRPHVHPVRALRPRGHRGRPPRAGGAPGVTPAPLLAIDGLSRRFGALAALNGVSLTLEPRERRAVIGPNGAGKTTLFNVITGQLVPSAGRMVFAGQSIAGLAPHAVSP